MDILLDDLSPGDLFRYSRTCKEARNAVLFYIWRRFDIQNVLGRYFTSKQISMFRELQSATGMFISGSTALQFMAREVYPESDLDLYVEHRFRKPIALWLRSIGYNLVLHRTRKGLKLSFGQMVAGYYDADDGDLTPWEDVQFDDAKEKHDYFGAKMVLNFEQSEPYRKIQPITSLQSPHEIVLNYYSTCVMNRITHEKAYSLYPLATFDQRRSLIYLDPDTEERKAALEKYAGRE
ncbi:hypothetical protein GALMADRAFT_142446 [Galerina marginata CBS 339.88]|uniref:F-box domain-containing protein n=1 Tax=Galerina marginata (strain CBS 339.88) TaxID=685588 RepID=A0A067T073_GALM3|nr:hypothetical protein GALMADRAFT_142446 [Galerina marginata CBS 339.88]